MFAIVVVISTARYEAGKICCKAVQFVIHSAAKVVVR